MKGPVHGFVPVDPLAPPPYTGPAAAHPSQIPGNTRDRPERGPSMSTIGDVALGNDRDALVMGSPPRGALPAAKAVVKRVLSESAFALGSVIRVSTAEPAIALTFDDGPHPEDTPRLLDVLERHGAKATFFVVGKSARDHPDLIERIAGAGHALGNHTWDHLSMPSLTGRFRRRQLAWTEEVLGSHSSGLFRPPYGEQSLGSRLDAARLGLRLPAGT